MAVSRTICVVVAGVAAWSSVGPASAGNVAPERTATIEIADRPVRGCAPCGRQEAVTNSGPVIFVVTFDDFVINLTEADITIGGTAGATTATVRGTGTLLDFWVTVDTIPDDGTVTLAVDTVRAFDRDGIERVLPVAHVVIEDTVIVDRAPPALLVPENPVHATAHVGADAAVVTYAVAASDDLDGDLPVDCTPPTGSRFMLGNTSVTCTATDSAGNGTTGAFAVVVSAAQAPPMTSSPVSSPTTASLPTGPSPTSTSSPAGTSPPISTLPVGTELPATGAARSLTRTAALVFVLGVGLVVAARRPRRSTRPR